MKEFIKAFSLAMVVGITFATVWGVYIAPLLCQWLVIGK